MPNKPEETSVMAKWLIRHSSGFIRTRLQADVVLFLFSVGCFGLSVSVFEYAFRV